MIRRISYCLLTTLALCIACAKVPEEMGTGIEITVRCGEPALSKASGDTQDGEDRYNENWIETVDFYFYPGENPDRNTNAVYHIHCSSRQRGSDVFLLDLTDEDVSRIFPIEQDVRKATVFAIANYHDTDNPLPGSSGVLDGTSLADLEDIRVETDFVLEPPDSYIPPLRYSSYRQDDFLMSGTAVIKLNSRTSNIVASGAVELVRYASKLTVSIKVAESVILGEAPDQSVWEPMLDNMAIYLVSGAKTVKLSGEDSAPEYVTYSSNKKRFAYRDPQDNDKIKPIVSKTGEYYNTHPIYMYPQHWTYGETKEESGEVEPYLKLELPWHRVSGGERPCYYKILIPEDSRGPGFARHFVRNNWYHFDIDVGLLGADTDEAAVELEGKFFMVPWQNVYQDVEKQADIGKARYISVDKTSYEIHNVPSIDIHYTSSHPITIKNVTATCPYYGTGKVGSTARGGGVVSEAPDGSLYLNYNASSWLTDKGTAVHFNHTLNGNHKDKNVDYSPITVTFTIVHSDKIGTAEEERYSRTITITQNPAIFIESLKNSDKTFEPTYIKHGKDEVYDSRYWGYVFVDGRHIIRAFAKKNEQGQWYEDPKWASSITNDYMNFFRSQYPGELDSYGVEDFHWRVIWYTGGSRDIFKIDVTVLPPDSEFIIGDPRTDEIDNFPIVSSGSSVSRFQEGYSIGGGETKRSLTYYYPAENSDRTLNMMAPSFRVASKCGGTEFDGLTEEQAKWRCASFQEDGFPAGRWRLPTKGEISFIATLSSNNVFERLFSDGGTYWSANGSVKVSGGTVTLNYQPKALIRCVYDTWYWGDDRPDELKNQDDRYNFYWGDAER